MKRRIVALVAALVAVATMGIGKAVPAHADAGSNPYHSSAGYLEGLTSCRWFMDGWRDSGYTGKLQTYTLDQYDAALLHSGNAYNADHNWAGFFGVMYYIDYDWRYSANYGSGGYAGQVSIALSSCAAILTQDGTGTDWVATGTRWNPCDVLTVQSSGPDISWIGELEAITGIKIQIVSSGAEVTVHWDGIPAGLDGNTISHTTGAWRDWADVGIRSTLTGDHLYKVLRHEMAHAIGLSHTSASNELMNPVPDQSSTPLTYNQGDYNGLVNVGVYAGPGGCG